MSLACSLWEVLPNRGGLADLPGFLQARFRPGIGLVERGVKLATGRGTAGAGETGGGCCGDRCQAAGGGGRAAAGEGVQGGDVQ